MNTDIIEEKVKTIMYNLAKCCTLSPQDCDLMIEGLTKELTTIYQRGMKDALAKEGFTSIEELEAEGDYPTLEEQLTQPFEIEMQ